MNRYWKDYVAAVEDPMLAAVLATEDLAEGDTLLLGGGEWHLYPEHGFQKEYYISNNDYGMKSIAFPLIGKKNVTVDGEGARLVFHGHVLPFVIDGSEGVTVRNLTVDYAEPMYFEGKIVDAGMDFVEMEYDESQFHCDVVGRKLRFYGENWENVVEKALVNEFDPDFKGPVPCTATYFACTSLEKDTTFLSGLFRYLTASKPAQNRLRLEGELGFCHNVGKYWLCTHNSREFPGIFGNDSKDITLSHVTLTHTLAMGVICQVCENMTLDTVVAAAGEGRMLSVDADATHFVNCSGLIHMKDCSFENMMDDATNIHGMYLPVERKVDERRALLYFGHFQQKGVNIFKPGDAVRLVDNEVLQPYAAFTVKSSTLLSGQYLLLETEEPLPAELPKGHAFENHSRMPRVHIENCNSGYNRPRGFLLSTSKEALVEGCSFHNIDHAIALTGDANSWYESGPSAKVILRNNRFDNAAYSGGTVIVTRHWSPKAAGKAYHGELTVENNYFRLNGKRYLDVHDMESVTFRGNTLVQDDSLPDSGSISETGLLIDRCDTVDVSL